MSQPVGSGLVGGVAVGVCGTLPDQEEEDQAAFSEN